MDDLGGFPPPLFLVQHPYIHHTKSTAGWSLLSQHPEVDCFFCFLLLPWMGGVITSAGEGVETFPSPQKSTYAPFSPKTYVVRWKKKPYDFKSPVVFVPSVSFFCNHRLTSCVASVVSCFFLRRWGLIFGCMFGSSIGETVIWENGLCFVHHPLWCQVFHFLSCLAYPTFMLTWGEEFWTACGYFISEAMGSPEKDWV